MERELAILKQHPVLIAFGCKSGLFAGACLQDRRDVTE